MEQELLANPTNVAVLSGTAVVAVALGMLAKDLPYKASHTAKEEHMPEGYKARNQAEQKIIDEYDAAQQLPMIPWLLNNIRWTMATYIVGVHVLAVIALPHLLDCKPQTFLGILAFYILGGFGITGGCHRLWAHKAYKGNGAYRFFVMILASIANQGTVYHWARDHRQHHKASETRADPHNALRGFFFAHVGWLLFKKDPRVKLAGQHINMDDLKEMPEIILQKRLDPWWNLFWCFGFPALVGNLLWKEDLYKAFLLMGVLKYVITLNFTWLVNSAAHLYGDHPYSEINPAENPAVSIVTMGEGWHNYHHAYPSDYACSELGVSEQYNPTKLFIDFAAKLGVVTDRKRAHNLWEMRKKNNNITKESLKGPLMLRTRIVE